MDSTSLSSHRLSPTVSPEPSSTRPNPFDDGDGSSRKRRRTSASGSPSASTEAMQSARPAAPSDQVNGMHLASNDDQTGLKQPPDPRPPPDHQPPPSSSSSGPPLDDSPTSNQVTMSLRNVHCNDSAPTSPQRESCESITDESHIKKSVEESESDLAQSLAANAATSQASSASSASVTPPIEFTNVQQTHATADYNEMSFESSNVEPSILDQNIAFIDPMAQFPFHDPQEPLVDTVPRLVRYIALQSPIESGVINQVRAWIDIFLKFSNQVGLQSAIDSCQRHRQFWLAFTDVFLALSNRKLSTPKTAAFHSAIVGLYSGFAELTAFFVNTDRHILAQWRTSLYHEVDDPPLLFSAAYLQPFSTLMRHLESPMEDDLGSEPAMDMRSRADQISYFVGHFQRNLGGGIEPLNNLATEIMGLIRAFPKTTDNIVPIVQAISLCLRLSCQLLMAGNHDAFFLKQQLRLGHRLWRALSSFMNTSIENHSTHFSSDCAAAEIVALTEMLRWCLEGDHDDSVASLKEHREKYPQVFPMMTSEAIAWEWKLGVFGKLVRCSQMQLRVMAVTTLCADLVTVFKRLSDASEDHNSFLRHLGSYLLEIKLIDYILGPNCHPEIIFESANIIGFLVVAKLYTTEHTDRLWQGITASQNPRVADALIRMTTTITNLFEFSDLLGICAKFETVPIEAFNPALRNLWDNVIGDLIARSQVEQKALTLLPFNLCLRLLREASRGASGFQVAHPEMQHAAMQKLKNLLASGSDEGVRRQLNLSCIEDLAAKSRDTLGSLWCLILSIGTEFTDELKFLIREHDLVRLVVEELEHVVRTGHGVGIPAVLSGNSNQPRREFISSLILVEPSALANDLGTRLWDILVGPRAPCSEDRKSGWQIISCLSGEKPSENLYLQMCVSQLLPQLPPGCYSEGMLEFVKAQVSVLVHVGKDCALDNEEFVANSIIEQLWRVMLTADNSAIVELAIHTMAIEVYLESTTISSYPHDRARQVHLALVTRCLRQMEDAASKLKASNDGDSGNEGEAMVIVATDQDMLEQARIFIRTLQFLQYFMDAHHSRPHFSTPDLRSLISHEPESCEVEGDLAHLKYQSFDLGQGTEVKPLHIGKLNTAASLLARLRRETGFENYRMFYRGRQFFPMENEICKSLEDLQLHDGLILVKRERGCPSPMGRLKPGTSPLDIKLLSHFPELWEYLSMDERIAKEVFNFLVKLPADEHIMDLFVNPTTEYQDVFLSGQSFKSLYVIHALGEYGEATRLASSRSSREAFEVAIGRSLRLVVQAISDQKLVKGTTSQLQVQLMGSLMVLFVKTLRELSLFGVDRSELPSAHRLVTILRDAVDVSEEEAVSLITSTLCSILRLGLAHTQFWDEVASQPDFRLLLGRVILFDGRSRIRELALGQIKETVHSEAIKRPDNAAASAEAEQSLSPKPLTSYIWTTISDLLTEAVKLPSQCVEFFEATRFIRRQYPEVMPPDLKEGFVKFAAETSRLLLCHTSTEEIEQLRPYDSVAHGLVSFLHVSMRLDGDLSTSDLLHNDLAERLFWRHLFPPRRSETTQPVSKVIFNRETRARMYEVISRSIRNDKAKLNSLLMALKSLVPHYPQDHEEDDHHLHFEVPFQFSRLEAVRSPYGYVGLRNLSNTCYLNSLLTQLFMNTSFRKFIMQSDSKILKGSQQLLFETQKLFGFLQESYHRFVDTTSFVKSIRNYDDTIIDPSVQMDVDEFFNLLFDRWEGQFPTNDGKRAFRSFYGGQLVQQVKSKECEHISERIEPFFSIQCDIKGKNTLEESLQAYVDGELMEGDNKYKCSSCDRHVDAVKRACLKDIPNHLIFHLKRFDFNLRTMLRSKINDYFSFPSIIDMQPYTIDHLSNPQAVIEDDDGDYFELVGILVHSGTAEAGHYYSYIRERPTSFDRPEWVEFNDENVSPWDPANMEAATFGGPDQRPTFDTNGIFFDKNYSAYMLFYQRASSLAEEQRAMSTNVTKAPLRVDVDAQLTNHLQNINTMAMRRHCLFDPNHLDFVEDCFSRACFLYQDMRTTLNHEPEAGNMEEQSQLHEQKDLAMEMVLGHFDQIVSRNKDTAFFETYAQKIKSAVETCADCAFAFYQYFCVRAGALRAMLQRNPDAAVRNFIGQLLLISQKKIESQYPSLYYPANWKLAGSQPNTKTSQASRLPSEKSVLEGIISIFNELWKYFHMHIRSWDEYFGTLLGFAKFGDVQVSYLLANDYLLKTLRIIVASNPNMDLPVCYAKMVDNIFRRPNNRPPKYTSLLLLIDYLLQHLEPVLGPQHIVETPIERLEHVQAPFPWSSDEVSTVHEYPGRVTDSFFVERLLAIEESSPLAFHIIDRLVATGEHMDASVLNVLRRKLEGDTTTEPMDPSLHYASRYLGVTRSIDHAQGLIRHISAQSKTLQHAEGLAFLKFFNIALNIQRDEGEISRAIRECSIDAIPAWAPYLLTYADDNIRHEAEQLMNRDVFASLGNNPDGHELTVDQRRLVGEAVQRLGMVCLRYLRETHINPRVQIGRGPAATVLRVIEKCASHLEPNAEVDDLQAELNDVISHLRRLIVDEIDEDGSDWDGSCGSSEPFEALQPVNEVEDAKLV